MPLSAQRVSAAIAPVGDEVFLYGGLWGGDMDDFLDDAVLADPDRTRVASVPTAPFDAPLYAPTAVASGTRVVVAGIQCDSDSDDPAVPRCEPGTPAMAVYDTVSGEWESVSLPQPVESLEFNDEVTAGRTLAARTVGAGGELVVVELGAVGDLWTYSLADRRWDYLRSILAVSDPARGSRACVSGHHLVVVERDEQQPGVVRAAVHDLFDDSPGWFESEPVETSIGAVGCADQGVMVISEQALFAPIVVLDVASRAWRQPARPPDVPPTSYPWAVWDGDEMQLVNGDPAGGGLAYDWAADSWRTTAPADVTFEAVVAGGGGDLVGVVENPTPAVERGELVRYRP